MQLITVRIDKPEAINFILGQTHFIKSVEDIHEALVTSVPGIKFGLAFCEASGKCLIRESGTDAQLQGIGAAQCAGAGAGHSFIVFLAEQFYPSNVLNTIKLVPEGLPDILRHCESDRSRACGRGGRRRHPLAP